MPKSNQQFTRPLLNAIQQLTSYVPAQTKIQSEDEKDQNGTFSRIFFRTISGDFSQFNPGELKPIVESKEIDIAILKPVPSPDNLNPRTNEPEITTDSSATAFHLLRERQKDYGKPFPFLMTYLSNGVNGKVALTASEGNFANWLKREIKNKSITHETLLDILAQILSVINYLHSGKLVHRDIKPFNFLAHKTPSGRIKILLGDLDDVAKYDTDVEFFGTAIYKGPETLLPEHKFKGRVDIHRARSTIFKKTILGDGEIKLMPLDCYSVGCTIQDILCLIPTDISNGFPSDFKKNLQELYSGLITRNPTERWTIAQAMESPLFGSSAENRKAFFQKLLDDFAVLETRFGKDYYNPMQDAYPVFNNCYFELPKAVRKICLKALSLKSQTLLLRRGFPLEQKDINALNNKILHLNQLILVERGKHAPELNKILSDLKKSLTKLEAPLLQAQAYVNKIEMEAKSAKAESKNYLLTQLKAEQTITLQDLHLHLLDETHEKNQQLAEVLKRSKHKRQDFNLAFHELDKHLIFLKKRLGILDKLLADPDKEVASLSQTYLDEKVRLQISYTELATYRNAIGKESTLIKRKKLPLFTESIHRMLFKARLPNHPANACGDSPQQYGVNTMRSFELSDKISSLKPGRYVGPLFKTIMGGVLTALAVTAIVMLATSTSGVFPAVLGLGYLMAVCGGTGLVGGTGVTTLVAGVPDLYSVAKNKISVVSQSINGFFKLPVKPPAERALVRKPTLVLRGSF